MTIPFIKMHGLGNDFVIIDHRLSTNVLDSSQITHLGNRRRGIGFDQLLTIFPARGDGDVFLKINNPDGSEAEACGNGTRCVADLVMREGNLSKITIETVAGKLYCHRTRDNNVSANMGIVKTNWDEIPLIQPADTSRVQLEDAPFTECCCVNIGNPHAVFFCDDADAVDLRAIGPILEKNKMFPKGANIEFATVKSNNQIRMRVWERGAGITEACGSGACAVLVASARNGLTGRRAEVILDGGSLDIEWIDDGSILMTGPTTVSFRGEVSL